VGKEDSLVRCKKERAEMSLHDRAIADTSDSIRKLPVQTFVQIVDHPCTMLLENEYIGTNRSQRGNRRTIVLLEPDYVFLRPVGRISLFTFTRNGCEPRESYSGFVRSHTGCQYPIGMIHHVLRFGHGYEFTFGFGSPFFCF